MYFAINRDRAVVVTAAEANVPGTVTDTDGRWTVTTGQGTYTINRVTGFTTWDSPKGGGDRLEHFYHCSFHKVRHH